MDIKTVYNQLTNVDIEQQKQIWDERGLVPKIFNDCRKN